MCPAEVKQRNTKTSVHLAEKLKSNVGFAFASFPRFVCYNRNSVLPEREGDEMK